MESRRDPNVISPDAMRALEAYSFPGNVRELENVMSRAVLVANSNQVTLGDLPQVIAHCVTQELNFPRTTPRASTLTTENAALPPTEALPSLTEVWRKLFPTLDKLPSAAALEDSLITHALQLTDANVTLTAQALGLSRATVYRRLRLQRKQDDL